MRRINSPTAGRGEGDIRIHLSPGGNRNIRAWVGAEIRPAVIAVVPILAGPNGKPTAAREDRHDIEPIGLPRPQSFKCKSVYK